MNFLDLVMWLINEQPNALLFDVRYIYEFDCLSLEVIWNFADLGVPHYHKRKTCYGFERIQNNTFIKKRKIVDRVLGVTSDGGFSSESVSNSPQKGTDGDKPSSSAKLHVAKTKDSHGK